MVIYEIKDKFCITIHIFLIVATEDRAPAPRETQRNPVDEAAEQHRRQVEKRCKDIVDKDVRCDRTCHRSCTDCGKHMLKSVKASICEAGECGCTEHSYARFLLLPCWYGMRLI